MENGFDWQGTAIDLQAQGFTAATNGFPGFSPDTAGTWSRSNMAVYVDAEADVFENWTLGVAVRWEDHENFGNTVNGKMAMRLALRGGLALRGTVSTGFRVPTPGQSNAINATSKLGGEGAERLLSIVATIAPTSSVGRALGGVALEPEKSTNASVGAVYMRDRATASLDCFHIRVRDRLALSKDIELNRPDLGADRVRADLIAELESEGLTSASSWNYINYFTNDFTTITSGCEATGRYRFDFAGGVTTLSGVYNRTRTRVDRYTVGGPLDNAKEIRDYQSGLPGRRYQFEIAHSRGPFDLSLRYGYHGVWYDSEEDLDFDGYGMIDAALVYALTDTMSVTLAAENLLDERPNATPTPAAGSAIDTASTRPRIQRPLRVREAGDGVLSDASRGIITWTVNRGKTLPSGESRKNKRSGVFSVRGEPRSRERRGALLREGRTGCQDGSPGPSTKLDASAGCHPIPASEAKRNPSAAAPAPCPDPCNWFSKASLRRCRKIPLTTPEQERRCTAQPPEGSGTRKCPMKTAGAVLTLPRGESFPFSACFVFCSM